MQHLMQGQCQIQNGTKEFLLISNKIRAKYQNFTNCHDYILYMQHQKLPKRFANILDIEVHSCRTSIFHPMFVMHYNKLTCLEHIIMVQIKLKRQMAFTKQSKLSRINVASDNCSGILYAFAFGGSILTWRIEASYFLSERLNSISQHN